MAIDIQRLRLGYIEERHCSLFHAIDRFRILYPLIGTLWDKSFTGLTDDQIFHRIDQAIFTGEPIAGDPDYWPFMFLTNTGEQFDDAKTFIVGRPNGRVHVLYELREGSIGSASCTVATFQRVAKLLVAWFDEQIREAGPPYFQI